MNAQQAKQLQEKINDTTIHMLVQAVEKAAKRVAEDESYLPRAVDLRVITMLHGMLDAIIEGEGGPTERKSKKSKHARKPLPKTKPGSKPFSMPAKPLTTPAQPAAALDAHLPLSAAAFAQAI